MNEWIRKYGLKAVMGAGLLLLAGCQSNYSLVRVEGGRVPITAVYDEYPDKEAEKLVEHYKEKVDSIMSPVIGYAAATLTAYRPESPLSNLIADVLRDGAKQLTGQPADVAVMNMGGIRNALPEGNITYGTIYEIAPFENALCVVTMDGATLETLFSQIASVHGEGISGASWLSLPTENLKRQRWADVKLRKIRNIRLQRSIIWLKAMISWRLSVMPGRSRCRRSICCGICCLTMWQSARRKDV